MAITGLADRWKRIPLSEGCRARSVLTSKSDLVKALAESLAFCDDVFASTTDENALAFVRQGPYEVTRASLLYGLLAHDAEMYGIATVYLRATGIVPPSTERQGRGPW